MRNTRRQPQRIPPPLLRGSERIDGEGILEEFPGDPGLVLWKTFRSVQLWTELEAAARQDLYSPEAFTARCDFVRAMTDLVDVADPLLALAEMYRTRLAPATVVSRCRQISQWAEGREAGWTALEFGQLAAIAAPTNADLAVGVARYGRDLAEYSRAESWYWQAIVRARKTHDWQAYIVSMLGLGITHRLRGNYPLARRSMERGLRRAKRQGLTQHEAMALHELTVLAIRTDNMQRTLEYGRGAMVAYGPANPRLPWLAHDLGVFWMNRGYFKLALEVFQATSSDSGQPADRVVRQACIARAAGALNHKPAFTNAAGIVDELLENPLLASRAATTLLDVARGALSCGELERAGDLVARAGAYSKTFKEGEQTLEADALAAEIRASTSAARQRQVRPPEPVSEFASELLQRVGVGVATAV